jgi:hypothetical protein
MNIRLIFIIIIALIGKFVVQSGSEILDNQECSKDPIQFLKLILQLKDKFDRIIKDSFRSDKKIQKKLKESFEEFINKDNRCASHLATYIDDLLKSGMQGSTEEEIDSKLEKVNNCIYDRQSLVCVYKLGYSDLQVFIGQRYFRKLLQDVVIQTSSRWQNCLR